MAMTHLLVIALLVNLISAAPQYFTTAPADETVVQGQTATLLCRVANRTGAIQWTKNGFALGFSQAIAGFPRYWMNDSDSLGIYDLIISSVQLSDDAVYQCQVGPTSTEPALSASANLTVLVPAQTLTINGYTNGSTITVLAGNSLYVVCTCPNSRPPPSLVWIRNNGFLPLPVDAVTQQTSTVSSVNPKLWDTSLILSISSVQPADNGVSYTCQTANYTFGQLSAFTVQLSVAYGPSTVSMFIPNVIAVGKPAPLVCETSACSPACTVAWFDVTTNRLLSGASNVELVSSTDAAGYLTVSTLSVTLSLSDNGTSFGCSALNNVTKLTATTTSIINNLYFPTTSTASVSTIVIDTINSPSPITGGSSNQNSPTIVTVTVTLDNGNQNSPTSPGLDIGNQNSPNSITAPTTVSIAYSSLLIIIFCVGVIPGIFVITVITVLVVCLIRRIKQKSSQDKSRSSSTNSPTGTIARDTLESYVQHEKEESLCKNCETNSAMNTLSSCGKDAYTMTSRLELATVSVPDQSPLNLPPKTQQSLISSAPAWNTRIDTDDPESEDDVNEYREQLRSVQNCIAQVPTVAPMDSRVYQYQPALCVVLTGTAVSGGDWQGRDAFCESCCNNEHECNCIGNGNSCGREQLNDPHLRLQSPTTINENEFQNAGKYFALQTSSTSSKLRFQELPSGNQSSC